MSTVPNLIQGPTLRVAVAREVRSLRDLPKDGVRGIATRIDQSDLDARAAPIGRYAVESHHALAPTMRALAWEFGGSSAEGAQANGVDVAGVEQRILNVALPMVRRRPHINRQDAGAVDGKGLQGRLPRRVRYGLSRKAGTVEIDSRVRERPVAVPKDAKTNVAPRSRKWQGA